MGGIRLVEMPIRAGRKERRFAATERFVNMV